MAANSGLDESGKSWNNHNFYMWLCYMTFTAVHMKQYSIATAVGRYRISCADHTCNFSNHLIFLYSDQVYDSLIWPLPHDVGMTMPLPSNAVRHDKGSPTVAWADISEGQHGMKVFHCTTSSGLQVGCDKTGSTKASAP